MAMATLDNLEQSVNTTINLTALDDKYLELNYFFKIRNPNMG
jgi:hypothetical protein